MRDKLMNEDMVISESPNYKGSWMKFSENQSRLVPELEVYLLYSGTDTDGIGGMEVWIRESINL